MLETAGDGFSIQAINARCRNLWISAFGIKRAIHATPFGPSMDFALYANPSNAALRREGVHYMFSRGGVESIFSKRARHGQSDRHHGEIQPSQRRSRRRRFSLWGHPSGRGSFARLGRAGRCCAGMETLVADPAAARRSVRHAPGTGWQQSRQTSESFATHCVPPSGSGSPLIAIAKVNSSVRKFSSTTITVVR